MAYTFTLTIGNEQHILDPMSSDTKLSELLLAIQRKSAIPPNRQHLIGVIGDVNTSKSNQNQTLLQLQLPNKCTFLVLDTDPHAVPVIAPSPNNDMSSQYNKHFGSQFDKNKTQDDNDDNDIIMNDNKDNDDDDDDLYTFPLYKFDATTITIKDSSIQLLTSSEQQDIHQLLFGILYKMQDVDRWYSQGFGFVEDKDHNNDIRFGLLQIHGGPCGVLAPVQAYMVKEMLYNNDLGVILSDGATQPILPTNNQRESALINALIEIMFRVSIDETYISWIVAIDISSKKYYKKIVSSRSELRSLIRSTMSLYQSCFGVISFVYSVILSRTIHVIHSEVDDISQSLILPQFGHCSQELVNLMITGRCVTNIHDGDKVLGDPNDPDVFTLRGISPNQTIGFLTTLEPMRLAKVGSNYKCPKYPIWVVGSSSHYTTLFSLNINVGKLSKFDKKRKELRNAFNQFDPEENGIVPMDKLSDLLTLLKSDLKSYQVKSILDPDNNGVLLWSSFERGWKMLEKSDEFGWNCSKCTLWNKFDDSICSICYTSKGNSPLIPKPKDKTNNKVPDDPNEPPKNFIMYLYNGLKTTKKDRPTLTKLNVFDEAELTNFTNYGEELTGLIKTKFPNAIVEFDSPFGIKLQ